ncbi:MAG: N-acetylmuramoyl-L-alanine amidase [Acidobacteriota bacterium]
MVPATLEIDEDSYAITIGRTSRGPLFPLQPLVDRLGGELVRGAYDEGWTLSMLGRDVLFGAGSPALSEGEEFTRLSQPPADTVLGIAVPLDLLQDTLGRSLGYEIEWRAFESILSIRRFQPRRLSVRPEIVHFQGTTTLAFEFSEVPRYRLSEEPGRVVVSIQGDRLEGQGGRPTSDPLVRQVLVEPSRIVVSLAPDARSQSYVLEAPYRLVFDIYAAEPSAGGEVATQEIARPRRRDGVHTIVIDPGHGGTETGAIGPSGVEEKDLTLVLAQALKRRLESRLPVKVVLTRSDDSNLPLEARTSIANQNKADLFISLHLNSAYGASAHGAETYILSSTATDARAADFAEVENRSAGEAVVSDSGDPLYDLQLILWDLSQSHHLSESLSFASLVQEELNGALGLRDRGVKQAPFRVLMGASMPSVLVELGFLSNPKEESMLQDPAYRAQLVGALVRAVIRYRSSRGGTGAVAPQVEAAAPGLVVPGTAAPGTVGPDNQASGGDGEGRR